ncbi:DegT/DnrJ/EryC1/StrS family aminotransferase [Stutzerimonas stutzeri]|uniref:Aminotransferase DegT n=1 Tax=Stutzerimonas stutzeri TaxID=316 RepID=A0A2N8RJB6_STUST|nr:DegT/DnrJ/EryC1/StrS family aminotransferase [Stutzerimonas stutzeri]MCQ4252670.1 DegT/DnrJ/EryC1/StrS family aminotransferase [Stutzerimonas stutzeri]MCQ4264378.1 DegT/DnrJ/EryC1/StrS family aminotransferase [Stutzerimonas stutzeri]PNF61158.1 aminotransferase DegT [Stutzerimonas stutzeri]POH85031.1 aminotransferase DegT [Stutzerimonas stutzeri]
MINVTKSYLGSKNKLKAYIDRIYNTGWLTNNGPLVTALEQRLKDYLGVRNIILTNNGTIALQIAYRALGINGSAITTPFSFVATTSSLQWEGIKPIFADIDPATWNLDPNQIERHIQQDTSAIVATHVFGNPCDVERIEQIARIHNLKVVYDGAHAFGVRHKGQSVYKWGDISTLSFHATKLFHTIEGGAIVTNDDELADRVRLLCNFGIVDTDQIEGIGINAKLNEFSAAMGMCVLDDIELILECRAEIGRRYEKRLADHFDLQLLQPESQCNYSYFPIALDDENQLLRCRSQLNENGVNPRRYFYPSLDTLEHLQPQTPQPRSRALSRRVMCLPIYPGLPRKVQEMVVQTLIQESVHSSQSSRTLFQPFVEAFGMLGVAEPISATECKHIS